MSRLSSRHAPSPSPNGEHGVVDFVDEGGESACTTSKTFASFKTGVKHKQLLRDRGGACSLPEVGGALGSSEAGLSRLNASPALRRYNPFVFFRKVFDNEYVCIFNKTFQYDVLLFRGENICIFQKNVSTLK